MPTPAQYDDMQAHIRSLLGSDSLDGLLVTGWVLERKDGLVTDPATELVDPIANLPVSLHQAWSHAVASTMAWVAGLEYLDPDKLYGAITRLGAVDMVISLQAAASAGYAVIMMDVDFLPLKVMLEHIFKPFKIQLLNDGRLTSLMRLSTKPNRLAKDCFALFKEVHAFSPMFNPSTMMLVVWQHVGTARVRLYRPDGSYLVVCWWVLKALLLPERPAEAALQLMSVQDRVGPWRSRLVAARPQVVNSDQPLCLPGAGCGQDGSIVGTTHTTSARRSTVYQSMQDEVFEQLP